MIETLHILGNPEEVEAIRQGTAEIEAGQFYTEDEIRAVLAARTGRSE